MQPSSPDVLNASPIVRALPSEIRARLAQSLHRRRYRRGEIVCHQGDPGDTIHIIESGRVKVMVDSVNGEQALLTFLGPGECFGELALVDGEARSATVQAVEDLQTAVLRRTDFLSLVHENRGALEALLHVLASTIRRLSENVADLGSLDIEGRLAKKLLELAGQYGRSAGETTEIELRITQEELASMIGATRTSVNKALGFYEGQGAIQRRGRRLYILNPGALERRIY